MRLSDVQFERYGPFTDRSLHFAPAAKLHLVYGRNASGKSCALAGITDLFFGIEQQTRYNFKHEGKNMRLGATLVGRDGSELTFKRRKGTKGVLSTTEGAALPDGAVLAILGSGLTRNVFMHAFGLNSEQLRRGAKEMLDSEGEVGVSMYAAASGLVGITRLRRSLEDEAGEIFRPGKVSQKRRFDQAAGSYAEARQEMMQRTLRADKLRAQRTSLETAREVLARAKAERDKARVEHSRLTQLRNVAPRLRSLDAEREFLNDFADLPEISTSDLEALTVALKRWQDYRDSLAKAEEELERANIALAAAAASPMWVQFEASVKTLQTNVGKYRDDSKDKARVAGDVENTRREIVDLGARVGLTEDQLVAALPTEAAIAGLTELIEEGEDLNRTHNAIALAIGQQQSKIASLTPVTENPAVTDPSNWQIRFAAFQPLRSFLEQRRQHVKTIEQSRRRLNEKRARMRPGAPQLEVLATCTLPSEASIRALTKRFSDGENALRRYIEKAGEAKGSLLENKRQLDELSEGAPVASVDRIGKSRSLRDEDWLSLRKVLLDDAGPRGEVLRSSADLHEMRVSEADTLADAAAHDAQRVTRYQVLQGTVKHLGEDIAAAVRGKLSAEEALVDTQGEWEKLWSPLTSEPASPAEMLAWAGELSGVLEGREDLLSAENEVASLNGLLVALHSGLLSLAAELELSLSADITTDVLLGLVEEQLTAEVEAWRKESSDRALRADAKDVLDGLKLDLSKNEENVAHFKLRWADVTPKAGVDTTATLAVAKAVLHVWQAIPSKRIALEKDMKRVQGMERNIFAFEKEVERLSEGICPTSLRLAPLDQAKRLGEMMDGAVRQRSLHDRARARVAAAERDVAEAQLAKAQSDDALKRRLQEHALDGEAADTLDRLLHAGEARKRVSDAEHVFLEAADGATESAIRDALRAFDLDAAKVKLTELEGDFKEKDDAVDAAVKASNEAQNVLSSFELGTGAERPLQEMKRSEVEMEVAARDYLRLKLSSAMLDRVHDAGGWQVLQAADGRRILAYRAGVR